MGRLSIACVLLLTSACAAAPSFDLTVTRIGSTATALEQTSGFTTAENIVIRDQPTLDAVWATIYQNTSPRPPAPVVNFSQFQIVGRAMGQRATGGYDVVISGLVRQGGEFVVQVRETQPGPGCGVTTAITSPVDLARIARSDDPVKFAISTQTRSCTP